MKFLVRLVSLLVVVWLALLVTGYGMLVGSHENAAGIGLQCQYLTARGVTSAQYLHSDSGIVGISDCPLLKKTREVVDN